MPRGTTRPKCAFRKVIAPEAVPSSESNCAERILARFVALAYAADHAVMFTSGTDEVLNGTDPVSEVPSLAQMTSTTEVPKL